MKKVLYVATVDVHIRTFHLPYLKLLHDNGYEVHVATNGNEQFPNCDVKHQICIERSPFKLNNIKAIKQLKKIIKEEKFEIIHCHTPMGAVVTRLAARSARKKYGTKVIYTAHGFHFYKGAPKINWILFYPIEKYLAKYTDTIITINKEDYNLATNKFNKKCHDIQYIPGVGIDIEKFQKCISNSKVKTLKKSLGLSDDDYVLMCIARLDKNKNQLFLINVMNDLVKKNKKIHLLLVGQDELNGFYQRIVKKKNLDKNIHFLGRREDVPDLLKISNIVVSSSLREGLPVNVIEAFASGKPVVALSCRGMHDLIINNENGFIVSNENEMREKILEIKNNSWNFKIIKNNLDKANNYSISKIVCAINCIYNKKKIILHVLSTSSFSGAENVACTIINSVDHAKYDMYYCSPNGVIKNILEEKNINYIPLKKLNLFELKRVIDDINPSVIHSHDFKASFLASIFYKKVRVICHLHKNDPKMSSLSIKSMLFRFLSKRFNIIIGVSNSILDEYIFKNTILNKFFSIPNYVDENVILSLSEEYRVNKKYDLFYFGRLSIEKNPLMFIEIIKNINNKNIKSVMIGDGPLKEECIKKIKGYGLEKNIDVVGFKKNPYPYILSSKIGIMPSKYEGFGLTAIESLILNKIVLNSGAGGLKEIFKNNDFLICNSIDEYISKYILLTSKKSIIHDFSKIISRYTNKKDWISKIEDIYN